jgi:hypothetical protein
MTRKARDDMQRAIAVTPLPMQIMYLRVPSPHAGHAGFAVH